MKLEPHDVATVGSRSYKVSKRCGRSLWAEATDRLSPQAPIGWLPDGSGRQDSVWGGESWLERGCGG